MFKKRTLIPAFLCMLLLATACTAKSEDGQDKTEKTSEVKDEKDGKKKKAKNKGGEEDTSLGNTYWICKEESEYEDRNIELIINEDGTFHFRELGYNINGEPYYRHFEADSYTWSQTSDEVEFEFATKKPNKKEVFYANILSNGDKMKCPDMFGWSEEDLTFEKQDEMPKLTSIKEDSGKLVGEWELVAVDGVLAKNISAEGGKSFESSLKIYEEKNKMYADYHIVRWEGSGSNDLEKVAISLKNEPLYDDSVNEFWSAAFDEEISPDEVRPKKKLKVQFTLVGDNKLVLKEEDPEDLDWGAMVYIYLRKDSEQYADREDYFYSDTVTVSNIEELVENLKNSTRIILKEGTYNFSDIKGNDNSWESYNEEYGYTNHNVIYGRHIKLEAEEGAAVNILINSPTSNVLEFNAGTDISLKGLTLGHNVEKGQCTGGVFSFNGCENLRIEDCHLFGCGTYGVSANGVYDLKLINSEIYECTYGLAELQNTNTAVFENCILRDSEGFNQFEIYNSNNIRFENCEVRGNKAGDLENLFIRSDNSVDVKFKNCKFKDNTYKKRNNGEVEFTDCEFNDKN